jgi:hypothetical protein
MKGLIAWRQWPAGSWLATPKAKSRLLEFFTHAEPIQQWLSTHVGPSQITTAR